MFINSELDSLKRESDVQQQLLKDAEVKNLRLMGRSDKPRFTRSAHSQIMLNAEVYELKKQVLVWQRKVDIKTHELSNLQLKYKNITDDFNCDKSLWKL